MTSRVLAFYLPQFHPVRQNNEWWGAGFTEWTNVAQGRPLFTGHHQPHIPADLGFYDLRLKETREEQAKLALQYGVDGFCYYHYWFNGKMLLDRPFEEVLSSGEPDYPFCLCWANENWTRAWDGLDRQVLIRQEYTREDAVAHIDWFIRAFKDPRYIQVSGRPLLLIYRPDHLAESDAIIKLWRGRVLEAGFSGLYLCAVKNGFVEVTDDILLAQGYDAIVDFQPNRRDFPKPHGLKQQIYSAARRFLPNSVYQWLKLSIRASNTISYRRMVEGVMRKTWPRHYRKFPCVFPSWDNTARRKTPTIIQNDRPEIYQEWLRHALKSTASYPQGEQFVFINAWNEWAEGCHLEPDRRNGRAFLEATRVARVKAEKVDG